MNQTNSQRRTFLAALGAGSLGAAAVFAGIGEPQAATPQAALPAPQADSSILGYQESEHVRKYYRSTCL